VEIYISLPFQVKGSIIVSVLTSHNIANSLYCYGIGTEPPLEEKLVEHYKFRRGKTYLSLLSEAKRIARCSSDANYAVKDIDELVKGYLKFKGVFIKFRVWFFGYDGA
jgi:hypothetical protein